MCQRQVLCACRPICIYIWGKKKKGTEKITYSTHSTYFPNGSSIHPLGSNWVQTVAAPLLGGANERTRKKNDQYSSSAVKVRKIGASFYEGHITITLTRKRTELDIYYTSSRRITFFFMCRSYYAEGEKGDERGIIVYACNIFF